MTDDLIIRLLKYIRSMELMQEWEWGQCRKWGQLKKDHAIPEEYNELVALLGYEPPED